MKQTLLNPFLQESLFAVRGLLHKNCQPYIDRLAPEYQPAFDWLNRDLLPVLIILPNTLDKSHCCVSNNICNLALAMEISFLAGRVHDLMAIIRNNQPGQGRSDMSEASRAILVGDYLYTLAANKLAQSGYSQWLERIGRTLCRRSEAKLARLRWQTRPYVSEKERLANLHKEHAEGVALAAEMAVANTDWSENERQAWTEFGFYVGQAQGVLLNEPGRDCSKAIYQAEKVISILPLQLQASAKAVILNRFGHGANHWRKEYEQAVK